MWITLILSTPLWITYLELSYCNRALQALFETTLYLPRLNPFQRLPLVTVALYIESHSPQTLRAIPPHFTRVLLYTGN